MTLRHRIRFYQQLAVLARAGVPIRSSLERLKDRISGREISILSQKIDAGNPIGEAFIAAGFSPFEYHLVTAGERSAQLAAVYQHLSEFWSRQLEMIQALTSQLYYPFIMLNVSIIGGTLLQLASAPWHVVMVNLIESLALFYTITFAVYMLLKASWQSDVAQRFWLSLPIIGRTLSTACAYRWITALKLEYSAGVPMPDAVADAWRASDLVGREQFAREGQEALLEGGQLSVLVQRWKCLPRDWVDFIETGEISGALETALTTLDEEAARAWKFAEQRMTDWLPKILYFIMLLIIGAQLILSFEDYYNKNVNGPINDALKQIDQSSQ